MSDQRPTLFPVRVTLADGTSHHPVRVATDTAGTTRAWAWDHGSNGPVEIGSWPADELTRADGLTVGRPRAFTTRDGATLDGRDAGCGCGHPLKAWRPALTAPRG